MTDEVQNLAEVETALAPEVTATTDNAQNAPEENVSEQQKTFTQEELDAIISKRLAKEQRKWEREQKTRAIPKPVVSAELPSVDQFETPEAYADALAERKAVELIAQREAQQRHAETLEAYHEREEEIRNKYDDFEQVAYNPKLPVTDVMAQTIQASFGLDPR